MSSPKKMRETMIIVGAGIGGLSAGCYAQMNGYKSRIFELHGIPGLLHGVEEGGFYLRLVP